MSEKHHIIPVWFFVGILLLTYGVLIFISGLTEWSTPPANVALSEYYAPVRWGAQLFARGGAYSLMFRPGRKEYWSTGSCGRSTDRRPTIHWRLGSPIVMGRDA